MTSNWKLAAEEMDALKDSGHELDGSVEVNANISAAQNDVVRLHIPSSELSELVLAAQLAGENVGEFIRRAALERARSDTKTKAKSKRAS